MEADFSSAERDQLRRMAERMAIGDVLTRYCRALDRMDLALARSCYHPGGTDDRAPMYCGDAEGMLAHLWPLHEAALTYRHVLSNVTIELDGDRAGSESYWTLTMRIAQEQGAFDLLSGGRYVDRFDKRDGLWAIVHRQVVRDWSRTDPVSDLGAASLLAGLIAPQSPDLPPATGRRDGEDPSYRVLKRG